MSAPRTDQEQLKWFLLDHGVHRHVLGAAYDFAHMLFSTKSVVEINELVRASMLELYDDGLILLFYSTWDDGWSVEATDVDHLERAEVVSQLDADEYDPDRLPFFDGTEKGSAVLLSLQRTKPGVQGNVPPLPEGSRGGYVSGFTDLSD